MFSSRRGTVRHFHFQEISPKKFMPRNDGDKFSFWHKPFRVLGEQSTSSTWIWNKWFQAKRRLKIGVFIIVQGDFPPNKCPPCKIMETSKRSHCFREDKAGIQKRSEEGKRPKKKTHATVFFLLEDKQLYLTFRWKLFTISCMFNSIYVVVWKLMFFDCLHMRTSVICRSCWKII